MSGLIEYYARRRRAQAHKKAERVEYESWEPPVADVRPAERPPTSAAVGSAWTNGHVTNVRPVGRDGPDTVAPEHANPPANGRERRRDRDRVRRAAAAERRDARTFYDGVADGALEPSPRVEGQETGYLPAFEADATPPNQDRATVEDVGVEDGVADVSANQLALDRLAAENGAAGAAAESDRAAAAAAAWNATPHDDEQADAAALSGAAVADPAPEEPPTVEFRVLTSESEESEPAGAEPTGGAAADERPRGAQPDANGAAESELTEDIKPAEEAPVPRAIRWPPPKNESAEAAAPVAEPADAAAPVAQTAPAPAPAEASAHAATTAPAPHETTPPAETAEAAPAPAEAAPAPAAPAPAPPEAPAQPNPTGAPTQASTIRWHGHESPPDAEAPDANVAAASASPADDVRSRWEPWARAERAYPTTRIDAGAASDPAPPAEPWALAEHAGLPEPAARAEPAPRPEAQSRLNRLARRSRAARIKSDAPDELPAPTELAAPAQPGPRAEPPGPAPRPETAETAVGLRERSRVRRRAQYLRQLREVQMRDLGAFMLELHRFEKWRGDLVGIKLAAAAETDRELRALEGVLGEQRTLREVREAGIGGACTACGAIHGSVDRFCAGCGAPLGAGVAPAAATARAAGAANGRSGKATLTRGRRAR